MTNSAYRLVKFRNHEERYCQAGYHYAPHPCFEDISIHAPKHTIHIYSIYLIADYETSKLYLPLA